MSDKIERHPFKPFIPADAKILICGTFPPPMSRWSMEFYYPNYINDMWRIMGLIFFSDKNYFIDIENKGFKKDKLIKFLNEKGMAFSDTGVEAIRIKDNASDKFLEIRETIDLPFLLNQMPDCHAVVTTGEKAAGVIASLTDSEIPSIGKFSSCYYKINDKESREIRHWRMPSTSRAYPLALEKKAEFYKTMLDQELCFSSNL